MFLSWYLHLSTGASDIVYPPVCAIRVCIDQLRISIVSAIYVFFLVMVLFSEVKEKVPAELDSVVEKERLPSMNDYDLLPYINAVCKEVLR